MSLFDELAAARAQAVAEEDEHPTGVPSWPEQFRAVWKPLNDPASIGVLVSAASGGEKQVAPQMVRILQQSLVRFEVTEDPEPTDGSVWEPVLGDDGKPLVFDERLAAKLREGGRAVDNGAVAVALAMCGGAGGLITLAGEVGAWQMLLTDRVAEATQGLLAAQRKTLATAPRSE